MGVRMLTVSLSMMLTSSLPRIHIDERSIIPNIYTTVSYKLAPRIRSIFIFHVLYVYWGENRRRTTSWSGYFGSSAWMTTLLRVSIAETEMTTQSAHLKKYTISYWITRKSDCYARRSKYSTLVSYPPESDINLWNPGMYPRWPLVTTVLSGIVRTE